MAAFSGRLRKKVVLLVDQIGNHSDLISKLIGEDIENYKKSRKPIPNVNCYTAHHIGNTTQIRH